MKSLQAASSSLLACERVCQEDRRPMCIYPFHCKHVIIRFRLISVICLTVDVRQIRGFLAREKPFFQPDSPPEGAILFQRGASRIKRANGLGVALYRANSRVCVGVYSNDRESKTLAGFRFLTEKRELECRAKPSALENSRCEPEFREHARNR